MTVATTAHLNFDGNARAALELYATAFDAEMVAVTYGQAGIAHDVADADRVMWGQVQAANGFRVMAFDVPQADDPTPGLLSTGEVNSTRRQDGVTLTRSPFFLSVRGDMVEEIAGMWDKLSVGATVIQPFGPVPWSPAYGMLRDAFGVTWMLDIETEHDA